MTQLVHLKNFLQVIDMSTHFSAASICLALPKRIELEYYTFLTSESSFYDSLMSVTCHGHASPQKTCEIVSNYYDL